jgi:hypothetical protein
LDRQQAMTLLKHMVISGLVTPDWISIEKANDDRYKLKIKMPQTTHELDEFLSSNCLTVEKQNDYLLISQP